MVCYVELVNSAPDKAKAYHSNTFILSVNTNKPTQDIALLK